MRNAYNILDTNLKKKTKTLRNPKRNKYGVRVYIGFIWLRIGPYLSTLLLEVCSLQPEMIVSELCAFYSIRLTSHIVSRPLL
jgi:hypothetical protein